MEAIGLPNAAQHRAQHQRALAAFDDLALHNPASGRRVLTLMPRWFLFHLANMDLSLANALQLLRAPPYVSQRPCWWAAEVTDSVPR